MTAPSGDGIDVAFDGLVGRETLGLLAARGRLATYGVPSGGYLTLGEAATKALAFKNAPIVGFGGFAFLSSPAEREALAAKGRITPRRRRSFPRQRRAGAP